jgi:hypothetical protein
MGITQQSKARNTSSDPKKSENKIKWLMFAIIFTAIITCILGPKGIYQIISVQNQIKQFSSAEFLTRSSLQINQASAVGFKVLKE